MHRLYFLFLVTLTFLVPLTASAFTKDFQNQTQRQSLNNLVLIIEDTQRYQHSRSRDVYNGQLSTVLNRIKSARRLINNLGKRHLFENPQNATKPFAFIQTPFARKRLVKTLTELEKLHQDYRTASFSKSKRKAKKIQRSISRKGNLISRDKTKWTKKVGNLTTQTSSQACHYFKPNSHFSKTWASCCDINNGKKSQWTKKKTGRSNTRFGNCAKWGVRNSQTISSPRASHQATRSSQRVCRNLRTNDSYFRSWRSCCDLGNNKSRWVNKKTHKAVDWKGSCSKWGIR